MNQNLTEIVIVLDESGSMGIVSGDTLTGLNAFLEDQKKSTDGKALLTVSTFSYGVRTIVNGIDMQEVEPLTENNYRPGGGTALLDAIGKTIEELEDRYTNEEDKSKIPSKVLFVIITDGEENSSKVFTKAQVTKMIKHQTNRHGWEVVFLGANLDAVAEARKLGINTKSAFNFAATSRGISDSFGVLSSTTNGYRESGVASYSLKGTSLEEMNKDRP